MDIDNNLDEQRSLDGLEVHDARQPDLENPEVKSEIAISNSFQHRKWLRLRKHYRDEYLEVFNRTRETEHDDYFASDLPPTQLGAVLWQPNEKAKLYHALSRRGRHDLATLSTLVESKSAIEVKAYLDHLREIETNRQRFETQPKNVSHADIPAAFEISPECEAALNKAADALLAFQDRYDFVAGQQANKVWLIDYDAAVEIDAENDERETRQESDSNPESSSMSDKADKELEVFRLRQCLDLSERFFMSKGPDDPDSWQNIADQGQRPALTLESITVFYDLVVDYLRRLVKSCMLIAQSRWRAESSSNIIRLEDAMAAFDVLGVEKSADPYWISFARRHRLQVLDDAHRRGVGGTVISYAEVEEMLSHLGRSRSGSAGPKVDVLAGSGSQESSSSSETTDYEDGFGDSSTDEEPAQESEDEELRAAQADGGSRHELSSGEDNYESEMPKTVRISRDKRLQILEDQEEEYLEMMDHEAQRREEERLLSLLGADTSVANIKEEQNKMEDVGPRPPQPRKSMEDCMGWTANYVAEWETRAKKRRRLNSSSSAEE